MNYLLLCYNWLCLDKTESLLGTMKSQKIRLHRHQVKPDVKTAYDIGKEFFITFSNAYIIEAVMNYFNLTDVMSVPDESKYEYPVEKTLESMQKWAENHFNNIVHRYVGIFKKNSCVQKIVPINSALSGFKCEMLPVAMSIEIYIEDNKCPLQMYSHLALDMGLLFQFLLNEIKYPDKGQHDYHI